MKRLSDKETAPMVARPCGCALELDGESLVKEPPAQWRAEPNAHHVPKARGQQEPQRGYTLPLILPFCVERSRLPSGPLPGRLRLPSGPLPGRSRLPSGPLPRPSASAASMQWRQVYSKCSTAGERPFAYPSQAAWPFPYLSHTPFPTNATRWRRWPRHGCTQQQTGNGSGVGHARRALTIGYRTSGPPM